jgi:hypothetical protein
MRPDISLGQEVDGELHARGLSPTAAARIVGVPDRTLRSQLSGRHPVQPIVAQKLLAHLDEVGPWVNPKARWALVILGKAPDRRGPGSPLTPIDVKVDTVVLGIEVLPERRVDVDASLRSTFFIPVRNGDENKGYGHQGMVGLSAAPGEPVRFALAWWAPYRGREGARWLRIQLSPWFEPHCRLLRRLLRMASSWDAGGLVARRAAVYVARFDVALTYAANPSALVLQRPKAMRFRRVEDEDGAITWYAGSRGGEVYVRVYDYAAHHRVPGPLTRVEAAIQPAPQPELHLLEASVEPDDPFGRVNVLPGLREPFRNIGLGALHAPDLDFGESALLAQAREVGIAWAQAHLATTSSADLVRLEGALAKAAASRMLYSPSRWLMAAWVPLVEDLKLRLLYAEDEEGEALPWWWPEARREDELP